MHSRSFTHLTLLIIFCFSLSGCPEKSPPVTQNHDESSLIPQAHAKPAQPVKRVAPPSAPADTVKTIKEKPKDLTDAEYAPPSQDQAPKSSDGQTKTTPPEGGKSQPAVHIPDGSGHGTKKDPRQDNSPTKHKTPPPPT